MQTQKSIVSKRNMKKVLTSLLPLKSLENNSRVMASKNITNTPKIVINKPQLVNKPEVVTMPKIVTKLKKVSKPRIVDKSEIVSNKKYDEYKKPVIGQLKSCLIAKKRITLIMMMKNTEE